jgi:signal transduction histidine kinase
METREQNGNMAHTEKTAMTSINLKRFLNKKGIGASLIDDMRAICPSVCIQNVDGTVLFGTPDGSPTKHAIRVKGEIVGWVSGEESSMAALMINRLVDKEADLTDLTDETLDLYRLVNLLYGLTETMADSFDTDALSTFILEQASRFLPATGGLIALVNPQTSGQHECNVAALFGSKYQLHALIERDIVGTLLSRFNAEVVNEVQADEFYDDDDAIASLIYAPLKAEHRVIGALILVSDEPDAYTAKHLKLLNVLAQQATFAIEMIWAHHQRMRETQARKDLMLREQENRHLTEFNRLKDDYVQMVSHDLKNPLTVIMGYVELLQDQQKIVDSSGQAMLSAIEINARKMQTLISDVLNLARIEGGGAIRLQSVSLGDFLEHCLDGFDMQAKAKRIALMYCPPARSDVLIDPELLRQALTNLLSNAIKYTAAGGRVELSAEVTPTQLVVEVRDTGLGIPTEELAYIFEKFYRVRAPAHLSAEGTGLGLAIVKTIVELHRGRVRVESKPGLGSNFKIYVPLITPITAA